MLFTQDLGTERSTSGRSSMSTSREDHEAHHKSRYKVNKIPDNPRTEASTQKTSRTWMFTNEINSTREIFSQPRKA
jgi:hypothetical protein